MKKTIYIIEYNDGQETLSEWFIDEVGLSYDQSEGRAVKYLADSWDMTTDEVAKSTEILAVYAVSEDQIAEVVESRK